MDYRLNFEKIGPLFAVPTEVVDAHIKLCSGVALKLLLVLLRQNGVAQTAALAQQLGLSPADVRDELQYWVNAGLLSATTSAAAPPAETPLATQPAADEHAKAQPEPRPPKILSKSARPKLTSSEIAQAAKGDRNIQQLLEEAQNILGRLLNPSQTEALVSLYTYGGLPVDVILMVVSYCCDIGKNSMRYIETVAYEWLDKGIDSYEKAEAHILELSRRRSREAQVKTAFGLRERRLSQKEAAMVDRWFGTFGYELPMLQLAYERTVDAIGEFSFPYCDKILSSWHEAGYKTPGEAAQEAAAGKGERAPLRSAPRLVKPSRKAIDTALDILAERRAAAKDAADTRQREVYEELPRVKEIDGLLSKTGFQVAKAVLSAGDQSQALIAQLREKNLALQKEKEQILAESGLGADYLQTPYHCKRCGDTGYVDGAMCTCLKELLEQNKG